MSNQNEDPAFDDGSVLAESSGSWSANGAHHGETAAAEAVTSVANADPTAEVDATAVAQGEVDGEAPEAGAAEAPVAEAPAAEAAIDAGPAAPSPDDPETFLGELVRAMQTTAGAERARIAADTDRRREEHLAAIQARRESETDKMRALADDDLKAIDAWAEEERQRIQLERERRAKALSEDLTQSLAEHSARIDREVASVEAAISAYRIEVDAFFAALDRETDPVAIAQHAGRRPLFPALDAPVEPIAAVASAPGAAAQEASPQTVDAATAESPAEREPVAVMDPHPGAGLATSVANWAASAAASAATSDALPDTETAPGASGASGASADVAPPDPAPVGVPRSATDDGQGRILHAVPSGRPLGWLRRDRDTADRQDEDR